jgi:hypothetical protein
MQTIVSLARSSALRLRRPGSTWVSIACLAALLAEARPADACSCYAPPPPCENYWEHDAVFAGKAVATRVVPAKNGGTAETTFDVSEDFTGNVGARVVVSVGTSTSCSYEFEKGTEYFVYATRDGTVFFTGACTGTKPLSEATEDLAYARHRPQRKLAVIEGTVKVEAGVNSFGGTQLLPRGNAVVSVRGTAIATRTANDGSYRLDVPPGSYTLDVTDPGARIQGGGQGPAVKLPDPAACARRDIDMVWDGRIRGRILDHTGKPAAKIIVSAHGTRGTRQSWRLDTYTDANGSYEIREVPEGSFVVAVNHPGDGGPYDTFPIPPTFYPGVDTEAKAKVIAMQRSGLATKIDFQLPPPLAVYTVTGVVRKRGKPLPDANVQLHDKTWNRGEAHRTDAAGVVSFRQVAGSEIELELCRPDANPSNYKTACVQAKRRVTGDVVIDLEMPR